MAKPCDNCPFVEGSPLNRTLKPDRLEQFEWQVSMGQPFYCHKTTLNHPDTEYYEDPRTGEETHHWGPHMRVCRGSIDWADSAVAAAQQT